MTSKPIPIPTGEAAPHDPSSTQSQEDFSSLPLLRRTTSSLSSTTPTEKGYDHLQQVKEEEKKKMEWDIHCTCCEGAHHPSKRKESRDVSSSGCTPSSPLSPRSKSKSPAQSGHQTPSREKEKGECKNCEGCEKSKTKEW